MGGVGRGRRASYCGRDTTEDSMPLDIRRLCRVSALVPGRSVSWEWTINDRTIGSIRVRIGAEAVTLVYNYAPAGRPAEVVHQQVALTTTPCALGGSRTWFACPACDKRVGVIYGVGRLFACRQCKGLASSSQGEAADDRAARRADRIRKRLGWAPCILNDNGFKPKGMHWHTYERLIAAHDVFVGVSVAGIAKKLGLLRAGLAGMEAEPGAR